MLTDLREICGHHHVTPDDYMMAVGIIGGCFRPPDLVIAPDGVPYLYRWHVVPLSRAGNIYFHIQVADDPLRPLHDHPWDNMSTILAGSYIELLRAEAAHTETFTRVVGDTIFRRADWSHRLLLPKDIGYTMTLFSTGLHRRRWGFWYPEGWRDAKEVCRLDGNMSTHMENQ